MNLNIYTSYHKEEHIINYSLCSKNSNNKILFNTADHLSLQNINDKNQLFGEFVTMYYAYYNDLKCDYIGFEHYRRRFKNEDIDDIQNLLKNDIVVVGYKVNNPIRLYFIDTHENGEIFDTLVQIINNKYGKNNMYSMYLTNDNGIDFYTNSLFIMNYNKFRQMFEFIWELIIELDKKIGGNNFDYNKYKIITKSNPNDYQFRIYGFLIERLISCWIYCNYYKKNIIVKYYNL